MALGFGIASFAMGAASMVMGANANSKARRKQRELEREQKKLDAIESKEIIRRSTTKFAQEDAEVQIRAAASGFGKGSSLDKYVDFVVGQHQQDLQWMKTSGASVSAMREKESEARYSIARSNAAGSLVGGAASLLGSASNLGETYQKYGWGFTPKTPAPTTTPTLTPGK